MTEQELNQYLVDIDLKLLCLYYKKDEDGNLVLDEQGNPVNDYYQATTGMMDISEGWYQLIHDLIAELITTDWDRDIHQIKEKFGGLRFYIGAASDEVHAIVMKYEKLSYETCEVCGEAGRPRTDLGWHRTLCDRHYKELVIEKTQEAIQSGLNRVMRSGLPVEVKNVLSRDKYRMWETKVYWEIPAMHCSEEFDDVLKCLKNCETYLDALSKEEKQEYRNKLGYDV